MHLISTLRRVAEALLTAIGVVVGLTPDPTHIPVRIRADREASYRR
jgi:hypothetical protein